MSSAATSSRLRRPRLFGAALLLTSTLLSGCAALGIRPTVDEATAREVLERAVGLALSGADLARLCDLSPPEGSTCADTLEEAGDLLPTTAPTVRCAVPVGPEGPLRNGTVLVLDGVDATNDTYTTEFIVYDTGAGPVVLDAVFWSGLSVQTYDASTVTWQMDSASQTCARTSLPGPEG